MEQKQGAAAVVACKLSKILYHEEHEETGGKFWETGVKIIHRTFLCVLYVLCGKNMLVV